VLSEASYILLVKLHLSILRTLFQHHDVNWDPHNRGPDAKEKKDPPIKWETDPPELLEHRGFSLLIPWDLRAIYQKGASQAQTAAYGAGPSSGNDLPPDATADAWDVDRMDIDE